MNDEWIDGGLTDLMRLGAGPNGQPFYLYAVVKKLQIFSGGWQFQQSGSTCLIYVGVPTLLNIKKGKVYSNIQCLTCNGASNYL
jgi:hypothetical protein